MRSITQVMIWLCALARLTLVSAFAASSGFLQTVHFKTKDGWNIVGVYHSPKKNGDVAILLHGVGAGKGEWSILDPQLWAMGMGTLAIDLRGHGESDRSRGVKRVWSQFSDSDWISAKNDVRAAVVYLKNRGFVKKRIGLIGGSIGANLASQAAVTLHLPWAVLLSPGMDYHGVHLMVEPGPRFCVAASPSDSYAFQTGLSLIDVSNVIFLQAPSGHGAQMLVYPEFVKSLLSWIRKAANIKKK